MRFWFLCIKVLCFKYADTVHDTDQPLADTVRDADEPVDETVQDADQPVVIDLKGSLKGLSDKNIERLKSMYYTHANLNGFSVKSSTSRKSKRDGSLIGKYMVCSCQGSSKNKRKLVNLPITPSPRIDFDANSTKKKTVKVTRTGCEALMRMKRQSNEEGVYWIVAEHKLEHNHPLGRPEWGHLQPAARNISAEKGEVIECMEKAGMKPSEGFKFLAYNACGMENVGHTQRDHINYVNRLRAATTGGMDAQNVIELLRNRAKTDPEFYYRPMFDEESRLCGLFWTDEIMKEDYNLFGDVLVFDTTYRTNKYEMICAPFVGVNNHWNNTMFGCAFLANEKHESFVWLFETFMIAMNQKKPITIFTDQDAAMASAINQV